MELSKIGIAFVIICLLIITMVGSIMIGGNMACERGNGQLAGFACVNYDNVTVTNINGTIYYVDSEDFECAKRMGI